LGQALARILSARVGGVHARAQATPGSVFNVDAVESGLADIAFAQGDAAYSAFRQGTPHSQRPHAMLRAVAVLYTNVMQIVVRRGDSIRGVPDLKGRRVGMGPTGSNTELTARIVLEANGLAVSDLRAESLGFDEASSHLAEDTLDADFVMASFPAAAIASANEKVGVRLLPVEDAPVRWIRERYPFYRPTVIPRETYRGQAVDVRTVGVDNVLVCRASLPEDLVQRITGVLLGSLAELAQVHGAARGIDPEQAPAAVIPLHPGAARFSRERELLR
jgi:hypothetical protein